MPQQPITVHGLQASGLHEKVNLLIDNLVNIKDTTGKFLLRLEDGRVIDTKGWNDWECACPLPPVEPWPLVANSLTDGPMASACTACGNIIPSQVRQRPSRPPSPGSRSNLPSAQLRTSTPSAHSYVWRIFTSKIENRATFHG